MPRDLERAKTSIDICSAESADDSNAALLKTEKKKAESNNCIIFQRLLIIHCN